MANLSESRTKRRLARRAIVSYLARYKKALLIGSICLVITNLLLLVNPWILKVTIDGLEGGLSRQELFQYALLFVGVIAFSGIFLLKANT